MKKYSRFLILFIFLATADQFLKFVFFRNSVCNKNIAWSIPIAPGVFYFLWIIIFFLLIYFFFKGKSFEQIAFTFMVSGAISNLADRVIHGCVIDYIDLKFWPIFNLADVYIAIGIIFLLIKYIRVSTREAGHQNF